ncbi:MAG: glycosyltransferase [Myxococcota bacterium]|nr:glycosyltransferase [Myxococcota bacterium]
MASAIIAFSKDWHEDPTSNHHVLRELAKTRRVLWLNSLATRKPSLSSSRDLGKIRRKLREFVQGAHNVEHDLWVATPLVLPFPQSAVARAVNRQILRLTIRQLRTDLGIDQFQLWSFLPNTAPYVGTLGEELAVYYCVDEWATFPGLPRDATLTMERKLLERVDVSFTTSQALYQSKRGSCRETHLAPHGVDHARFARALDPAVAIPADVAALPGPRIGFFGTLRDFIDLELIAGVARARPGWSVVLIGQQLTDLTPVRGLPNVHLLGQKPHDELPAYCKGFDAGLIPYRIDDDVKFINPLKLREYLSAGVPVVSTPMPEVLPYEHLCQIAGTASDTVSAIERALRDSGPAARTMRSRAMASETWEARVAAVDRAVEEIALRKAHAASRRRFDVPAFAGVAEQIGDEIALRGRARS